MMTQNCPHTYPEIKVENTQKKDCVLVLLSSFYRCVEVRTARVCVEILLKIFWQIEKEDLDWGSKPY